MTRQFYSPFSKKLWQLLCSNTQPRACFIMRLAGELNNLGTHKLLEIDSHFVSRREVDADDVGGRRGGESVGAAVGDDEVAGESCTIPSDWRIKSVAVAWRWSSSRILASSCAVELSTTTSRSSKLWIAFAKFSAI